MPALLIRHRVADYPAWKAVFDDERATRWSHGCRGEQVFCNIDEPGEMLLLLEWDDPVRARLYGQSDDLRESMANAGVTGRPDIVILVRPDDPPHQDSGQSGPIGPGST